MLPGSGAACHLQKSETRLVERNAGIQGRPWTPGSNAAVSPDPSKARRFYGHAGWGRTRKDGGGLGRAGSRAGGGDITLQDSVCFGITFS